MTIVFTKKGVPEIKRQKLINTASACFFHLAPDNQCRRGVVNLFCQCRNRCDPNNQLTNQLLISILVKQSDNLIIKRLDTSSRLTLKMSSSQLLLAISNPPDIISNGIILKLYHRVSHICIVYVNYCMSANQKVIGVFSTLKVTIVTV